MRFAKIWSIGLVASAFAYVSAASAAGAPDWMRSQAAAPVPAHDEETDAVVLYSETELIVLAPGKMKRLERRVFKILRRDGEAYGHVTAVYGPQSRITAMRGWSIPAQGKHFETRERDIIETALTNIDGGELVSDIRRKVMNIPAAIPGNIIGYEIEREMLPYSMTDEWDLADILPVREARYTVKLPAGWSQKVFWLNHAEVAPTEVAPGHWRWVATDLKAVKIERNMPPWQGIAARMVLTLQPPGGTGGGYQSWQEVGSWYLGLASSRRDHSPQLQQKVQELTAGLPDKLGKIQALAAYAQKDIRYVAIELGVGGVQPHAATEVLAHGYGDCKDKVTLLSSMLKEIGVESHYVLVNTARGSVTSATPPNMGFNHAIAAIQLPEGIDTAHLPAFMKHKTLGTLLFFDPTHPLIPLGYLPGALQANYGMLASPAGGELIALPQTASELNGVQRTAKLTLDDAGTLSGDVHETWLGDDAAEQRYVLRAAQQDADRIKPIESMLAHSLATFEIANASVSNLPKNERPLVWKYTVSTEHYAKPAGDLLIIRPRVLGSFASGLLETKEPRQHAIEFQTPMRSTDEFEITLPAGYVADTLPSPINQDLGAVSYRSSTTMKGNVLRYTRTFEVKELSVPASKAEALKKFFRAIYGDEGNSAVLKKAP
jgi:transglutaminase-like putative cysteine protease